MLQSAFKLDSRNKPKQII